MTSTAARLSATLLLAVPVLAGCGTPGHAWAMLADQNSVDLARLPELLHEARVVMIGERHKLVEPVETVKRMLSCRNCQGFTHVAIEWSASDQPVIDRYMLGDDAVLDRLQRKYAALPNATAEFFSLFSFVRDLNRGQPERPIAVRLIDVEHPVRNLAKETRDQHMFEQIERLLRSESSRVLVYVGAVHAAKSGLAEYRTAGGGQVPMATLGALLRRRYSTQLVSMKILVPVDPMWTELKRIELFDEPVAIRLTPQWPELAKIISLNKWRPDDGNAMQRSHEVFDYAVWWPTSRAAERVQ